MARLENKQESELSSEPLSSLGNQEACEAANRWLSRFLPLLNHSSPAQATHCRKNLALVKLLRPEGEQVLANLRRQASTEDVILLATLRQSLGELDEIESQLRQRLAVLSPGDPEGEVDLTAMRARLAEIAALREITPIAGPLQNQASHSSVPLTLPGSEPKEGLAWALGSCAVVGFLFTTYQALQMFRTVGLSVPDQLSFWIACWAASLAMLGTAFHLASREEVTLNGWNLAIHWRLGPFRRSSQHRLETGNHAYLRTPESRRIGTAPTEVAIRNANGQPICFGARQRSEEQSQLAERINRYLGTLPRDLPK